MLYSNWFFHTTDPVPNVTVPSDPMVGQSLLLGCSVTTLSNISGVDIVWKIRDGSELTNESVSPSSTTGNFSTFESSYNITLLSTDDDGRMYQCVVVINGTETTGGVTLDVTGTKLKWSIHSIMMIC